MDIKGTDDGLGVDQVLQFLAHGIVLLLMIPFMCILGFPGKGGILPSQNRPVVLCRYVRGHRADLSYPPRLGVFVGQASIRGVLLLSAAATAALETSEFLNHDERSLLP